MDQTPPPARPDASSDARPAPPLLLLSLLTGFGALSIDIVLPGLPQIAQDLDISLNQVQFTVGAFVIGMGLGQVFWGWLSDWAGRKPILLLGIAGYILVSMACALAPDGTVLLLFRGFQGVFAAAPVALSRAVVRDCYDGKEAAKALSTMMLVFFLTPMLAPLIGTVILGLLDWHAMFWFTAVFGAVVFALLAVAMPETLPPARHHRRSFFSLIQIGLQVFTHPNTRGPMLALIGVASGLFSYIALSPLVAQDVYGFSPTLYAWLFAFIAGVLILGGLLCKKLLEHYSVQQVQRAGAVLCFTGGISALTATLLLSVTIGPLIGSIMMFMVGYTLVAPNATSKILSPFGTAAGVASAMMGASQTMLGGTYSGLAGSLYSGSSLALGLALCGAGCLVMSGHWLDHFARE